MGVEPFLITSSIILIAAQRLVRKICENCKVSYRIDSVTAKMLGMKPDDKNVACKGTGCKTCKSTGYKGRIGLIETLILSSGIRNLILGKSEERNIQDLARKEGMSTLRENGIKKIIRGDTTIEEVLRVTVGDQEISLK